MAVEVDLGIAALPPRISKNVLSQSINGVFVCKKNLYEAANVLLTRVAKWSVLKARGHPACEAKRLRKAKVAVARKLAVILHRMWIEGSKWSSQEAANEPA